MSWWVYLNDDDGEMCKVRPFMGGGTVLADPRTMEEIPQVEAQLNVTSNYSLLFDLAAKGALYELGRAHGTTHEAIPMLVAWYEDGFHSLNSRRASEVRAGLELMVAELDPRGIGVRDDMDYWTPTPKNAAAALRTLVGWCYDAPDGTFDAH